MSAKKETTKAKGKLAKTTNKSVEKAAKKNETEKTSRVNQANQSENSAKPEAAAKSSDSSVEKAATAAAQQTVAAEDAKEKTEEKNDSANAKNSENLSQDQARSEIDRVTREANGGDTLPSEPAVIEESTFAPELSSVETNEKGDIESNAGTPTPPEVADLIAKQDATRPGNAEAAKEAKNADNSLAGQEMTAEREAEINGKLDERFPNAGKKNEEIDQKLDEKFPEKTGAADLPNNEFRSAQISESPDTVNSRLRSALREQNIVVEDGNIVDAAIKVIERFGGKIPSVSTETAEEANLPDGVRKLVNGTSIKTVDGSVVTLASDALVRFEGGEQAFAGTLSNWNPANVRLNAGGMRLKYDPNGSLLPLSAQTTPEEMSRFIASLDLHEAIHLGISRETYYANRENSAVQR